MNEPWFKLLKAWQDAGNEALTFPYLIGALRGLSSSQALGVTELRELLESVSNCQVEGGYFSIYRCGNLNNEWVLRRIPNGVIDTAALRIPSSLDPSRCVLAAKGFTKPTGHAIDHLTSELWKEIEPPVSKGDFSYDKDKKCYRPFKEKPGFDELKFNRIALGIT